MDYVAERAYMESGCIERTRDGMRCIVCGAEAPVVALLKHARGCGLAAAVEAACGTAGSGEPVPEAVAVEVLSGATPAQASAVDRFLDAFAEASPDRRAEMAAELRTWLPDASPAALEPHMADGAASPGGRAALRLYLLFEAQQAARVPMDFSSTIDRKTDFPG